MILVNFLLKFAMTSAEFLLPGSVSRNRSGSGPAGRNERDPHGSGSETLPSRSAFPTWRKKDKINFIIKMPYPFNKDYRFHT